MLGQGITVGQYRLRQRRKHCPRGLYISAKRGSNLGLFQEILVERKVFDQVGKGMQVLPHGERIVEVKSQQMPQPQAPQFVQGIGGAKSYRSLRTLQNGNNFCLLALFPQCRFQWRPDFYCAVQSDQHVLIGG